MINKEDITNQKVVNGITITKRWANEGDARDGAEDHLSRDLSHLTSKPEFLEKLYGYRMS